MNKSCKKTRIICRASDELARRVAALAAERRRSVSEVVRDALCAYFDGQIDHLALLFNRVEALSRRFDSIEAQSALLSAQMDCFAEGYFAHAPSLDEMGLSAAEQDERAKRAAARARAFRERVVKAAKAEMPAMVEQVLISFSAKAGGRANG